MSTKTNQTINLKRLITLSILAVLFALKLTHNPALGASNDLAQKLDKIISEFSYKHQFMGSVLIVENGTELYRKSAGVKNINTPSSIETSTPFKIASLTKQFTAAAILMLEESGKLSLDDSINQYLANPVEQWTNITLRHLLEHSSGIPDYTNLNSYQSLKSHHISKVDLVRTFAVQPLNYSPGSKSEYSNSGYFLLGMVIEKVSNLTYQEFIQQQLFQPLKMQHSGFIENNDISRHRATGHQVSDNKLGLANEVDMSSVFSAGNILTTTEDLIRWTNALFANKLLSNKSLKLMTSSTLPSGAYGVFTSNFSGITKHHHSGGIDGFTSEWRYFPERKLAIVVLGNVQSPAIQSLTYQIEKIALELPLSTKHSKQEMSLDNFAGTYQMDKQGLNSHFFVKDKQLFVLLPGKPPIILKQASEQVFHSELFSLNVHFESKNKASPTVLIEFLALANKVTGTKISIDNQESRMSAFTGVYKIRNGFYISVFNTNKGLFAQATGQPAVALNFTSPYHFDTAIAGLSVKFSQDQPAKYLILKQGGNRAKASRL